MLDKLLSGFDRRRNQEMRDNLARLLARNSELKRLAATRARSRDPAPSQEPLADPS